jgi:hypothetical protein
VYRRFESYRPSQTLPEFTAGPQSREIAARFRVLTYHPFRRRRTGAQTSARFQAQVSVCVSGGTSLVKGARAGASERAELRALFRPERGETRLDQVVRGEPDRLFASHDGNEDIRRQ